MLNSNHVYQGKPFAIKDSPPFRSDIIAYCVNTNESFELNMNLSSVMQFETKFKELMAMKDEFKVSTHSLVAVASFKLDNAENILELDESKIHLPSNSVITQYFETKLTITFGFNVNLSRNKETGIQIEHYGINLEKSIFAIEQKVLDCKGGKVLKIGWIEELEDENICFIDKLDTANKNEVLIDMMDSINIAPVIISLISKL